MHKLIYRPLVLFHKFSLFDFVNLLDLMSSLRTHQWSTPLVVRAGGFQIIVPADLDQLVQIVVIGLLDFGDCDATGLGLSAHSTQSGLILDDQVRHVFTSAQLW